MRRYLYYLNKVDKIPENNKKIACGVRIVERGKKKPPWMAAKKNQLAAAAAVDAELFPEHCANTRLCSQ